jgi:hypothetical protein
MGEWRLAGRTLLIVPRFAAQSTAFTGIALAELRKSAITPSATATQWTVGGNETTELTGIETDPGFHATGQAA